MNDYLTPPPGWHYSVHPWFSLDDIDELPDLVQVTTVLLPEFFHLAVGTEGMWAEGWPGDEDFALFLHFHVFDGKLTLNEVRSAGLELPAAYEKFRKVVPSNRWKSLAAALMARYLSEFMTEGMRPDREELPAHGPRAVTSYEEKPAAAILWIERLQSHAADAYASARDKSAQQKRKRNRITDDFLREVAETYQTADTLGIPPTREVANRFSAPHSTAAKWVSGARKKGFLPPPGEPYPTEREKEQTVNERRLELEWWLYESGLQDSIDEEIDPERKRHLQAQLEKYRRELDDLGELPGRLDERSQRK